MLDGTKFRELANSYIDESFLPHKVPPNSKRNDKAIVAKMVNKHIENVSNYCQSPIEIIFIHALILGFTRHDAMGLVAQPINGDVEIGIQVFTDYLQRFKRFTEWYDRHYSHGSGIIRYLSLKYENGQITNRQRVYLIAMC